MRPAWAQGRNFDAKHIEFLTATPGFILGESSLGEGILGGAGPDVPLEATFTSIQIVSPTTVEDGLFVHREVETCNLSATLPEKMDLRNHWIVVRYFGEELYRGRVSEARLTESVEVFAQYKPGNTATKTYRVALVATNDEERLANMSTPPRTFTNETLAQRITSWTGLSVTTQTPATDLPVNWSNAAWDTATVRKVYRGTDSLGSLLDTLRDETKLRNMTFVYQPQASTPFILKPNNQWIVGTAATALCFSDNPAHVLGQATPAGDAFVHLGRYVSYTSRTIGQDITLYRNAAAVRWGQYDVDSPPVDGLPVETVFGPYRASGAGVADTVVDLGVIDVASPGSNPYWLSRAITGTLPLKANPVPFTSEIVTPFQSMQQLDGTVPGMALLESDGVVERVAVLGREHNITPDRWTIRYVLGPPHLLDRSSDFDPGTAEVHALVAGPGGGQTTLEWVVPQYPDDVTMYEVVFNAAASTRLITSDQAVVSVVQSSIALAPGTLRQLFVSGSPAPYWVLYTSNPAPGTINPSAIWREGQPAYLGTSL